MRYFRKKFIGILISVMVCFIALGCIVTLNASTTVAESMSEAYFLYSDTQTKGSWYIGDKTSKENVTNRVYGKAGVMIPYQKLPPLLGGAGNPVTDLELINDFSEQSSVNYVEYPSWLNADNGIVGNIQSCNSDKGIHGYWLSSIQSVTPMEALLKRPDTTLYTDTSYYIEKSFQQITAAELEYTFNVTNDDWHQVAIYLQTMKATTIKTPSCIASIAITDLGGNKLANTIAEGYDNGIWYVFVVKGSFVLRVDKLAGNLCGLAGIFLDEAPQDDSIGVSNVGAIRQDVKDIYLGWTKKGSETLTLIYRKGNNEDLFTLIASTETNYYVDTDTQPSSTYTYMFVPARKRSIPSSIMEMATVNDQKNEIGALDVLVPDPNISVSKETAPYDLTKIEFEKNDYIVAHGELLTAKAIVYYQKNGVYMPYPNIEVQFTLEGDSVYSYEGINAYPNMNTDLGTVVTDENGMATFTYMQEYAGNYSIIASVQAVPDANNPEKGTAASSGKALFTQLEANDEKIPVLWTISDAIKPGDSVTITGNNLLPNSDLLIAYAPNIGQVLTTFDEANEPNDCRYLTLDEMIVTDSIYETGLSFIFPKFETAGTYDFWVKTSYGWSNGITLNAARPLYMNQDGGYEGVTIEVVGRNYYVSDFGIGTREEAPSRIKVKLVRIGDLYGNVDGITEEKIIGVRTGVRTLAENAVNNRDIDWTNPYKISFVVPKVNNYGTYAVFVAADGVVYRELQQAQTLTIYEKKAQSWDTNVFGPIVGNNHVGNDPLDLGFFWAQDLNYTNVITVSPNAAPFETLTSDQGVKNTTNYINDKMEELSANGGGVLYFPEGNYYISSIIVPEDVILVGAGNDKTNLFCVTKTGGSTWIKSTASNVGIARMHLELYEYSYSNPEYIVNFTEISGAGSYVDENLSTVNKFVVDCSTKFSTEVPNNAARALISINGKKYFLLQNCRYDGGSNPLYNSYSHAYATVRNLVVVNIAGLYVDPVAPTVQSSYSFIENVYLDLCDSGHAFSLRDCAYIADSFVTGSGSYNGKNIGEMIVFEPPGGFFATGKVLSATERTFTMTLFAGERIDQHTYYKYNGLAVYITAGKGAGQLRYFKNIPINAYGNKYKFVDGEKDWDIIPDTTSQFTIISPMEGATVYRFEGTQNKKAIFLYSNMMDSVVAECNLWDAEGIFVYANDMSTSGRFCPNIGARIENNTLRGVSPMTGKGGIGVGSRRSSSIESWGIQIMNISIRNNTLIDIGGYDAYYKPQDSEMPDQRGIVISTGSTNDNETPGDVRFITIENNVITGCEYGIYCENRLTGLVIRNNLISDIEANEDITFFAPEQIHITGVHTFYVDGVVIQESGEYTYGTALPILDETIDNVFLGWSLTENYDHEVGVTTNAYGNNVTLYAIYGKKVEFNYNYKTVNGTEKGLFNTIKVATGYTVESQMATYGDPFRVGYTFGGWYLDTECTESFDETAEITSNTIVYAKWIGEQAEQGDPIDNQEDKNSALLWILVGSTVGVLAVSGGIVFFIIKRKQSKNK